jgi:hypothetical protein
MKESTIEIEDLDKTKFCKKLRGRIFHVTYAKNLEKIKQTGYILVNLDCNLTTTFGNSQNSFFRKKGCVSVFDYESSTEEKWMEHMWKCNPLGPDKDALAFLFLTEEANANLIRWEEAKHEWIAERVVPYVEAGYKGNIPLSNISEILIVKIKNDNTEGLAYKLKQARNKRISG